MIIFAIIGFVMLFWLILTGLVKMLPWLIVIWAFVMVLGFVIDHWITLLLIGGLALLIYGIYLEVKKVRSGNYEKENK